MQDKNILQLKRITTLVLVALLLSSCVSNVNKQNVKHVKNVDNKTHDLITARVSSESKKFFNSNDVLKKNVIQLKSKNLEPEAIEPEFDPLDAINVTLDVDNGDVQNILRALAEQAGMSLLLEPELAEINRKISMHLHDVPASFVFNHLMDLLDLSGEIKNNVLIVRSFEEQIYALDFLQSGGRLNFQMGGNVFGANSGSEGSTNSSDSITGSLSLIGAGIKKNNPYEQLNNMLEKIIGKQQSNENKAGKKPGVIAENKDKIEPTQAKYSLNELAGVLYVKARPSQVKVITRLVSMYKDILSRQVLIEAQILDVQLSEQFSFGVDWTLLRNKLVAGYGSRPIGIGGVNTIMPGIPPGTPQSVTIPAGTIGDVGRSLTAVYSNGTFTAALNLLQGFGTVSVLSNPSIRAKNARPAFMSVGQSTQIISESSSTTNNSGGGAVTTTTDVTTSSVFNGIILGVEPFIDDSGTIHLMIHPMQSQVDANSLALVDAGGDTKVTLPVVDFKGMTTSLSLNDGDTVILGGLIDEKKSNSGDGIPGLNDIPYLGQFFGQRVENKQSRELVIVLRVTLI
ncbi:MAG: pilus (MSHA type) biogenesis protein MshL [Pseudomonadota bacterium]